jgi:glycosyltransferase involved in cell wall biosynthesis
MKPKVSVIMPVLNGKRFIAEAIESILAQTYTHYELVVVDDGSTDETAEIVHSFAHRLELRYVRHAKPKGIAPSMNDGVRNATGDLISFLDHDDAWLPEFLQTQAGYLVEHPDVAMVHSDFQTIDVTGNILEASVAVCRNRVRPSGRVFPELFMDSFIVGNSVLIRRECFEKLGLFDESLRWVDYHMWMRIARNYQVDYVGKVLTKYRQHATQSTRTAPVNRSELEPVGAAAIRKILELYPEVRREIGTAAVRRRMARLYFDMACIWFSQGALPSSRFCLMKCIGLWPANARYYMLYAASLLGPSRALALQDRWHRFRGSASVAIATAGDASTKL